MSVRKSFSILFIFVLIQSVSGQQRTTWQVIQQEIFDKECISCHVAGSPFARQSGLVLTADSAYSQLADVPPKNDAARADGLLRVGTEGLPSLYKSFLWEKVNAQDQEHYYDDHPYYGSLMPLGGKFLTNGQLELIRRWIIAGAPETGVVADESVLADTSRYTPPEFAPLEVPKNGIQLHLNEFDVWATGENREVFYYDPLNNSEDVFIKRIESTMRPGSHHFILYMFRDDTPADRLPQPFTLRDVRDSTGTPVRETLRTMEYHTFFAGTQWPYLNYHFPPGIALRLPAGKGLDMNAHYVNSTGATIPGEVYTNLYFAEPDEYEEVADILFLDNRDIVLPPQQETVVEKTFTFHRNTNIFMLVSHAHETMKEFSVYVAGGERDGELVYISYDWEHPPILNLDPPLKLKPGEGLRLQTTYFNFHDETVRYGLSDTDEMMILFGYYTQNEVTVDPPKQRDSWAVIQTDIFNNKCISCHSDGSSYARQSGLVLSGDSAYANLMGRPAKNKQAAADGLLRLAADGVPENSFLWKKINTTEPLQPEFGQMMPLGGNSLTNGELAFIREWLQAGAPETGAVADSVALQDTSLPAATAYTPLPAPQSGVQIVVENVAVQPGQDREVFVRKVLSETDTLYLTGIESKLSSNGRHARVFAFRDGTPADSLPALDQLRDGLLPGGQPDAQGFAAEPWYALLHPALAPQQRWELPDSVAIKLPPGASVDVDLFFANRKSNASQGRASINFYSERKDRIAHIADFLSLENREISLPPDAVTVLEKYFVLSEAMAVFRLWPQAHSAMRRFTATVRGGAKDGFVLLDEDDWEYPEVVDFDQPLELAAGDTIALRVEYENTGSETIGYGVRGEGEMMRLLGLFYPLAAPSGPPAGGDTTEVSTFELIQKNIFDTNCTVCHVAGNTFAEQSGLILTADRAYAELLDVPPKNAAAAADSLVRLGSRGAASVAQSFLWLKVNAHREPELFAANPDYGAGMPLGLPPLTNGQLEFLRQWIIAGAPDSGAVVDTLLLADTTRYVADAPFVPPAVPENGVQLALTGLQVQPEKNREILTYLQPASDGEVLLNKIEIAATAKARRVELFSLQSMPETSRPPAGFIRDVRDARGKYITANLQPRLFQAYLAGGEYDHSVMIVPEGYGLRLPENAGVELYAFFENAGTEAASEAVYINLNFAQETQNLLPVDAMVFENTAFVLPPNSTETVTSRFVFQYDTHLLLLRAETYDLGREFVVRRVQGGNPGETIYRTETPASAPVQRYAPVLRFGAGSGLELEVTYHNSGADTVAYGVPGQGEVMRLHAWVWSDQPTAVRTETPLPAQAALLPNYPNPFNPETRIVFTLPAADHVLLTVHDISGRLVARLVDGARDAGRHVLQWNAIDQPSGVYFVRLQTGRGFSQSRKLILLK